MSGRAGRRSGAGWPARRGREGGGRGAAQCGRCPDGAEFAGAGRQAQPPPGHAGAKSNSPTDRASQENGVG